MAGRLIYKDQESRNYGRFFATTTVLGTNPLDNVVMDFYEEYINSRLLKEVDFENDTRTYNQIDEDIVVVREKKASIMMTRRAAIELAQSILNNYKNGEGEE